jgi:hypothetical protein
LRHPVPANRLRIREDVFFTPIRRSIREDMCAASSALEKSNTPTPL